MRTLAAVRRYESEFFVRFFQKIMFDEPDKCWLWTAAVTDWGYGPIYHRSKRNGSPSMIHAHRIMWEFTNGSIPEGMFVLHSCDTPACVSPRHLFLGTHTDNMRDMVAKGRHRNGAINCG